MSERVGITSGQARLDLGERALEASATIKESLLGGTKSIRDYIVREPARALGLALGLGVLAGWLIKRR